MRAPKSLYRSSPNSLLFDLGGDRAYHGQRLRRTIHQPREFRHQQQPLCRARHGHRNHTGRLQQRIPSRSSPIPLNTPNQVYLVNLANSVRRSITPLNIPDAAAVAFSPDGIEDLHLRRNNGSSMLRLSPRCRLCKHRLPSAGPVNAHTVGFSPNGAFAFVAESAASGIPAKFDRLQHLLTTRSPPAPLRFPRSLQLPHNPLLMQVLPGVHIEGKDSYGILHSRRNPRAACLDATGFDIVTAATSASQPGTICPQTLKFLSNDPLRPAQRVELGQGTHPARQLLRLRRRLAALHRRRRQRQHPGLRFQHRGGDQRHPAHGQCHSHQRRHVGRCRYHCRRRQRRHGARGQHVPRRQRPVANHFPRLAQLPEPLLHLHAIPRANAP